MSAKNNENQAEKTQEAAQKEPAEELEARLAELEAKLRELEKEAAGDGGTDAAEQTGRRRAAYLQEEAVIHLFKDSDKYSRDMVVGVNGRLWKIKRGVDVKVPRYVAMQVDRSLQQDASTASLIQKTDGTYVEYANL